MATATKKVLAVSWAERCLERIWRDTDDRPRRAQEAHPAAPPRTIP